MGDFSVTTHPRFRNNKDVCDLLCHSAEEQHIIHNIVVVGMPAPRPNFLPLDRRILTNIFETLQALRVREQVPLCLAADCRLSLFDLVDKRDALILRPSGEVIVFACVPRLGAYDMYQHVERLKRKQGEDIPWPVAWGKSNKDDGPSSWEDLVTKGKFWCVISYNQGPEPLRGTDWHLAAQEVARPGSRIVLSDYKNPPIRSPYLTWRHVSVCDPTVCG